MAKIIRVDDNDSVLLLCIFMYYNLYFIVSLPLYITSNYIRYITCSYTTEYNNVAIRISYPYLL